MRNATKSTLSTFGAIATLAGLEHGIGEILQGSVAPGGLVISSWPDSEFFSILAGEPAMTIIPNLLASGILASLFSLVFLVWATRYVQRKHGGLVLILLSIAMLLVGGGFGPPFLGIILGTAAAGMNLASIRRPARSSIRFHRFFGQIWPWSFSACLIAWLYLFPGSTLHAYFFGVDNSNLVIISFFLAVGTLLLTILSGFSYDRVHRDQSQIERLYLVEHAEQRGLIG